MGVVLWLLEEGDGHPCICRSSYVWLCCLMLQFFDRGPEVKLSDVPVRRIFLGSGTFCVHKLSVLCFHD